VHGDCIRQQQRDCWKRYACNAARIALRRTIDACTGYGGGVSVYFGLSVGLQLLDVAFFTLALLRNHFTRCIVLVSVSGNVYGGGVSVYMGGYSSLLNYTGSAAAAVGDTSVRNASVRVDAVEFTFCSARIEIGNGNAYGGSFSFYLGGYAWSFSSSSASFSSISSFSCISTSGSTTANGVRLSISDVNSSKCSATTGGTSGANSYGGSMSVYIGAYTWSHNRRSHPFATSYCGTTDVSGLVVSISSSRLASSSAVGRTFFRVPACFNIPDLTRVLLAETPGASFGSNVSAL
jgi:hypothetical protein